MELVPFVGGSDGGDGVGDGGRGRRVPFVHRDPPFPMSSLPVSIQIDVFARMGLEELMDMRSQFSSWSDVLNPIINEKILLEDLRRKMVEIIELMKPGEDMCSALIRNCIANTAVDSKFSSLVWSLVLSLTIPERRFSDFVSFKNWYREDIKGLLAGVERAMLPTSIARRTVSQRRGDLCDKVLELMQPNETMSCALKRNYYGDRPRTQNESLAHVSLCLLLELSTPARPLMDVIDYGTVRFENIKMLSDHVEESAEAAKRRKNFRNCKITIEQILAMVNPGESLFAAMERLDAGSRAQLYQHLQSLLYDLLDDTLPFYFPEEPDSSLLREDIQNLIPRLEKFMLSANVFDEIYAPL